MGRVRGAAPTRPLRSVPSPGPGQAEQGEGSGWWCKRGIGKGQGHQVHSTVAQCSAPEPPWVRKEVSRIQNKSMFWEVKLSAGTRPGEDLGLLG